MPCQSELPWEYSERVSKELNKITRWLCKICADHPVVTTENLDLRKWYLHHQRMDEEREAREREYEKQQEEKERADFERLKEKYGIQSNHT